MQGNLAMSSLQHLTPYNFNKEKFMADNHSQYRRGDADRIP